MAYCEPNEKRARNSHAMTSHNVRIINVDETRSYKIITTEAAQTEAAA